MKYLLLIIFLTGCTPVAPKKYNLKPVSKNLCVVQCVQKMLYHLDELEAGVVKEFEKVCKTKFIYLDCCKSNTSFEYYSACEQKEVEKKRK